MTRRKLGWLGVLLLALLGGYLLFGNSDKQRVLAALERLAAAASSLPAETSGDARSRLTRALREHAVSDVQLHVPELATAEGPAAIVELWSGAEGAKLSLHIEQSDVRVTGDRAQATLLLLVRLRYPGGELRQLRTVNADFRRVGGAFRLERARASEPSHEEPEARP